MTIENYEKIYFEKIKNNCKIVFDIGVADDSIFFEEPNIICHYFEPNYISHSNSMRRNIKNKEYYLNNFALADIICGGVPITFKMGDFKIYELYEKLPIIVLDDPNKLHDIEYINNEYSRVTQRKNNFDLLKSKFWEDMIITTSNTI
jgi:hypothetical protein